jgi:hypothetical protein
MAQRTLLDRAIEEAGVTGGTIIGALLARRIGKKRLSRLVRDDHAARIAKDKARSRSVGDAIESAARLRDARTITGAVLGAATGGMFGEYGSNELRRWRKRRK